MTATTARLLPEFPASRHASFRGVGRPAVFTRTLAAAAGVAVDHLAVTFAHKAVSAAACTEPATWAALSGELDEVDSFITRAGGSASAYAEACVLALAELGAARPGQLCPQDQLQVAVWLIARYGY